MQSFFYYTKSLVGLPNEAQTHYSVIIRITCLQLRHYKVAILLFRSALVSYKASKSKWKKIH